MKLLGLNSPEIFIILVVLLSILGPQRIEKGFLLFKKILKFLLSKEETIETEVKTDEPEKNEVKKETIETEIKTNKPKKNQVKKDKYYHNQCYNRIFLLWLFGYCLLTYFSNFI